MDGRKISEIGDSMIGSLWKDKSNRIFILNRTYTAKSQDKYYVFIRTSGMKSHLTLNEFFVNRHMTQIT